MDSTPLPEDLPVLDPLDEDHAVHCWRDEQFRQLGFSAFHALELAASGADLGQARYLIGSGCAPELARRILG
jgi:hypothetical protein